MRILGRRERVETPLIEAPRNEYYENVSAGLGIMQVVLYLSVFAFVVLSLLRNTELITYRNFYYFFKDLNASAEAVNVFESDAVSYPTSETQSFALYREGLAVAGGESVTVFTATGRQTVSETIQYSDPIAEGAGRYLLVYEMGGRQYSLYNSYTQIFAGSSEYPIYGAAVSDNGMYALISRSEEYASVVSLYNSNFRLINRYSKNGYVTDVAINEKGGLLAIPTVSVTGGRYQTAVTFHKPYSDSAGTTVAIGQSLPLSCSFTERGRLTLLCNDGLSFVTDDGGLSQHSFGGRQIAGASIGEAGAAVALKSPTALGREDLLAFDANGVLLGNWETLAAPQSIDRAGNTVFYKTQSGVVRLDLRSGTQEMLECYTEHRTLLAVNESEFLLCSPQKAAYFHFS